MARREERAVSMILQLGCHRLAAMCRPLAAMCTQMCRPLAAMCTQGCPTCRRTTQQRNFFSISSRSLTATCRPLAAWGCYPMVHACSGGTVYNHDPNVFEQCHGLARSGAHRVDAHDSRRCSFEGRSRDHYDPGQDHDSGLWRYCSGPTAKLPTQKIPLVGIYADTLGPQMLAVVPWLGETFTSHFVGRNDAGGGATKCGV